MLDQAIAGKPIDGNGVDVTARSAGDALFVDHVRPHTDTREDLGVHVGAAGEEAAVVRTHRVVTAHDHSAVRVLDHDIPCVAGDKALEIVGVVGAFLTLDRIIQLLHSLHG